MRKLLTGMAILSTLLVSGVSRAATGIVDMTWDGCTGPVDKTTTAPGFYAIFITVAGADQAQKGYDVRVIYGNASQQVPDAWNFDVNGCQQGAVTQDVTSKVCPAYSQGAAGALQVKKVIFSPATDPYATSLMQVLLANAYADVPVVVPATRYFLERINFDHSASVVGPTTPGVNCGGFEQPMCFKLSYATYLDLAGTEIPFGRSSAALSVSFNGPSACASVPVQPKTWGSIKNQYRN